jgi:putative Holliday junction resolvase
VNPILGIDFGRARIGLAISDELRLLAHPLETLPASKDAIKRIAEIIRERKIDEIVVGVPRHMSGEICEAGAGIRKQAPGSGFLPG